ncbi:MAG: glycosyl hydrolase 108 family protein [Xanthobacteraceae bacterium]
MAIETYDEALRRLLVHEGGYTNHPSDPGGSTNFGITIHDYRRCLNPSATAADVRAMRLDEAKAIYRTKYWAALRCDELPPGLDYALFDYGVNSGTGRAGKVLQRLLGAADDGRIGDALLAAIRQCDARELIARLCDERLAFLKRLKTWPVFGSGWGRRVAEVRAVALVMAESGRAPASAREVRQSGTPGKGVVPINSQAQRSTAGGIAAAGAAAAQQAHHAGARTFTILAIVLAAAALAVAGWLAWRWRQRHLQES